MPVGRRTAATALAALVVLLIALPARAAATATGALNLVDSFYRAGALIFGGGHVVLPLLGRRGRAERSRAARRVPCRSRRRTSGPPAAVHVRRVPRRSRRRRAHGHRRRRGRTGGDLPAFGAADRRGLPFWERLRRFGHAQRRWPALEPPSSGSWPPRSRPRAHRTRHVGSDDGHRGGRIRRSHVMGSTSLGRHHRREPRWPCDVVTATSRILGVTPRPLPWRPMRLGAGASASSRASCSRDLSQGDDDGLGASNKTTRWDRRVPLEPRRRGVALAHPDVEVLSRSGQGARGFQGVDGVRSCGRISHTRVAHAGGRSQATRPAGTVTPSARTTGSRRP